MLPAPIPRLAHEGMWSGTVGRSEEEVTEPLRVIAPPPVAYFLPYNAYFLLSLLTFPRSAAISQHLEYEAFGDPAPQKSENIMLYGEHAGCACNRWKDR
jgi:hypothetical protein